MAKLAAALFCLFMLLSPLEVAAGPIVYSTFGPGDTFNPDPSGNHSWTIGGDSGPFGNVQDEIAASFIPSATVSLDTIRVAAFHLTGGNELDVYLSSGSAPGAPIESFSTTGVSNTPGILTFNSVTNPLLAAGTKYWVVMSTTPLTANDMEWSWNTIGVDGFDYRFGGSGGWSIDSSDLTPAFEVTATPEPASLLLFGTGLITVFRRMRKPQA